MKLRIYYKAIYVVDFDRCRSLKQKTGFALQNLKSSMNREVHSLSRCYSGYCSVRILGVKLLLLTRLQAAFQCWQQPQQRYNQLIFYGASYVYDAFPL
jgi:hypothetical protein